MKLLIKLYKNEMIAIFFISALFIWGAVSSVLAFQNKTQVVLIGKTQAGFKLITDEDKTLEEALNFIRLFLTLTFNFDDESYPRHISLAGDLMTETLWERKKPEFTEMAGFIKKNKIVQAGEILSIKELKSNQYEIEIRNYLFKKGNLNEKNKLVLLTLTKNQRSYENPWSYNVSNIEIK